MQRTDTENLNEELQKLKKENEQLKQLVKQLQSNVADEPLHLSPQEVLDQCKSQLAEWDKKYKAIAKRPYDPLYYEKIEKEEKDRLDELADMSRRLVDVKKELKDSEDYKALGKDLLEKSLSHRRVRYKQGSASFDYGVEYKIIQDFDLHSEGYRALFDYACKKTTNVEEMEGIKKFSDVTSHLMSLFIKPMPADYHALLMTYVSLCGKHRSIQGDKTALYGEHRSIQGVITTVIELLRLNLPSFSENQVISLLDQCVNTIESEHLNKQVELQLRWYNIIIMLIHALPDEVANQQLDLLSNKQWSFCDLYKRPILAFSQACKTMHLNLSPFNPQILQKVTDLCQLACDTAQCDQNQNAQDDRVSANRDNFYYAYFIATLAKADKKVFAEIFTAIDKCAKLNHNHSVTYIGDDKWKYGRFGLKEDLLRVYADTNAFNSCSEVMEVESKLVPTQPEIPLVAENKSVGVTASGDVVYSRGLVNNVSVFFPQSQQKSKSDEIIDDPSPSQTHVLNVKVTSFADVEEEGLNTRSRCFIS